MIERANVKNLSEYSDRTMLKITIEYYGILSERQNLSTTVNMGNILLYIVRDPWVCVYKQRGDNEKGQIKFKSGSKQISSEKLFVKLLSYQKLLVIIVKN